MGALRWLPLVVVLAGCHVGGGPVVAVGGGGRVSIGAQAGGGLAWLRSDLAVDVYDSGGHRGGMVSLGGWSFTDEPPERGLGGLGAIGASGTDEGTSFYAAAAPFAVFAPEEADVCDDAFNMATIALGVRVRGDRFEVFLAPHIHRLIRGCGLSS